MKKAALLKSKICKPDDLDPMLESWRRAQKKVVFTNGCFDLVHMGHIDYLSKAADEGDVLILGLNSDISVRSIKGKNRPIMDEESRAMVMAGFFFIDAVVLFDEDTPYNLIKHIQPDVLVKGSDYRIDQVIGHDIVQQKGGKVVTIDLVPGYSTSFIERKIRENL